MPSTISGRRPCGLVILLALASHPALVHSFHNAANLPAAAAAAAAPRRSQHYAASSTDDDKRQDDGVSAANDNAESPSPVSPSAITMDDGGSDLTDRFKYKVHALMGTYDPPPGTVNDENQTGSIIGAMLEFPAEYTFSVVGRTSSSSSEEGGEEIIEGGGGDAYADEVKSTLASVLGSDANMEIRVVPRGKKFTRVSAKVTVESASVISSIYEELGSLEATVMKF